MQETPLPDDPPSRPQEFAAPLADARSDDIEPHVEAPVEAPVEMPVEAPVEGPVAAQVAAQPLHADWIALPPEAATLGMIGGLLTGLAIGVGFVFAAGVPLMKLADLGWLQMIGVLLLVWLLVGVIGAWLAYRRWKSTAWKLDATGLHLRRGHAWRREILVPRSRVQHLDIERGPIERHFGLATLILHTAGTRRQAIRQAGLPDADAVALRNALVPASDRHDDVL